MPGLDRLPLLDQAHREGGEFPQDSGDGGGVQQDSVEGGGVQHAASGVRPLQCVGGEAAAAVQGGGGQLAAVQGGGAQRAAAQVLRFLKRPLHAVCTVILLLSGIKLLPADWIYLWDFPVLRDLFGWTSLGPGFMDYSTFYGCPRESICIEDALELFLLVVARALAYVMYWPMLMLLVSQAHNLRTLLLSSFPLSFILLEDFQDLHVRCGKIVFFCSTAHGIAHVVRWAQSTEVHGFYTDQCAHLGCGMLNATQRCYADVECYVGMLGCGAGGISGCRFCGGSGDYRDILCPLPSTWTGRTVLASQSALTGYVLLGLQLIIVVPMWCPPEKHLADNDKNFTWLNFACLFWRLCLRKPGRTGPAEYHYRCCVPRADKGYSKVGKEYEVRKRMHAVGAFIWAIFLVAHAPRTALFGLMGISFLVYLVDVLLGMFWRTYHVGTPELVAMDHGLQITFRHPKFFHNIGGYVKIRVPLTSELATDSCCLQFWFPEWHPYSIYPHPTRADHSCIFVSRQSSNSAWSNQLICEASAFSAIDISKDTAELLRVTRLGSMWIGGPYASPYSSTINFRKQIFLAMGFGITPALAQIQSSGESRSSNLVWITRAKHKSLLQFVLTHYDLPESAWCVIVCPQLPPLMLSKSGADDDDDDAKDRALRNLEKKSLIIIEESATLKLGSTTRLMISSLIRSIELGQEPPIAIQLEEEGNPLKRISFERIASWKKQIRESYLERKHAYNKLRSQQLTTLEQFECIIEIMKVQGGDVALKSLQQSSMQESIDFARLIRDFYLVAGNAFVGVSQGNLQVDVERKYTGCGTTEHLFKCILESRPCQQTYNRDTNRDTRAFVLQKIRDFPANPPVPLDIGEAAACLLEIARADGKIHNMSTDPRSELARLIGGAHAQLSALVTEIENRAPGNAGGRPTCDAVYADLDDQLKVRACVLQKIRELPANPCPADITRAATCLLEIAHADNVSQRMYGDVRHELSRLIGDANGMDAFVTAIRNEIQPRCDAFYEQNRRAPAAIGNNNSVPRGISSRCERKFKGANGGAIAPCEDLHDFETTTCALDGSQKDFAPAWQVLYCGGLRDIADGAQGLCNEHRIDYREESFDW